MKINIRMYPKHAEPLFYDGKTGRVHSVFDNVFNVSIDDQLFSFTHNQATITPMSIVLDCSADVFSKLPVSLSMPVTFSSTEIYVGDMLFSHQQALVHDLIIDPLVDTKDSIQKLDQLKDSLHAMMNPNRTQGAMIRAISALNNSTQTKESALIEYFKAQFQRIRKTQSIRIKLDCIAEMLGAGEGLTPSGDDFITGVLALWHYCKHDPSSALMMKDLNARLSSKKNATTAISQAYIDLAMTGRFNNHAVALFKSLDEGRPIQNHLEAIVDIGHSSGSDFLVGLYIGLEIGGI